MAKGSSGFRRRTGTLFCTTLDYREVTGTGVTPGLRSTPGWPVRLISLVDLGPAKALGGLWASGIAGLTAWLAVMQRLFFLEVLSVKQTVF